LLLALLLALLLGFAVFLLVALGLARLGLSLLSAEERRDAKPANGD
jgi:hypothetical protein